MRNTLGEDESGRRLLSCIRAYVELDVLSSLELHTDATIKYGRKMEEKFFKRAHASHILFGAQRDETITNVFN